MKKEIGILLGFSLIALIGLLSYRVMHRDVEGTTYSQCTQADGSSMQYELRRNSISAICTLQSGDRFTSVSNEYESQTNQKLLPFMRLSAGNSNDLPHTESVDQEVIMNVYSHNDEFAALKEVIEFDHKTTMNWNDLSVIVLYPADNKFNSASLGLQRIEQRGENEVSVVSELTLEPEYCTKQSERKPYIAAVVPNLSNYQMSIENFMIETNECRK